MWIPNDMHLKSDVKHDAKRDGGQLFPIPPKYSSKEILPTVLALARRTTDSSSEHATSNETSISRRPSLDIDRKCQWMSCRVVVMSRIWKSSQRNPNPKTNGLNVEGNPYSVHERISAQWIIKNGVTKCVNICTVNGWLPLGCCQHSKGKTLKNWKLWTSFHPSQNTAETHGLSHTGKFERSFKPNDATGSGIAKTKLILHFTCWSRLEGRSHHGLSFFVMDSSHTSPVLIHVSCNEPWKC